MRGFISEEWRVVRALRLLPVTAGSHVVQRTAKFETERSDHDGECKDGEAKGKT